MYFMLDGDEFGWEKSRQEGEEEVKEVGCSFKSDAGERSVWASERVSQDLVRWEGVHGSWVEESRDLTYFVRETL